MYYKVPAALRRGEDTGSFVDTVRRPLQHLRPHPTPCYNNKVQDNIMLARMFLICCLHFWTDEVINEYYNGEQNDSIFLDLHNYISLHYHNILQ